MKTIERRLFLGASIHAPWPASWPRGRLIAEQDRHTTLVFLGALPDAEIQNTLQRVPLASFSVNNIGSRGYFDSVLLLPKKHPRVVAWHVHWFDEALALFQADLARWLHAQGIVLESREWLSHVTVCRNPISSDEWQQSFTPLPCYAGPISLYESLGYSKYRSLMSFPVLAPFEELEHTADLAFRVYGSSFYDLYESAFTALAFQCPDLLAHWTKKETVHSLEEIVIALNDVVSRTDRDVGCPFKAVSFHGEVRPFKNHLLEWEMIIDV